MKKTISLILGMFLILLTGCGKSSKLIRPTDSAETQETTRKEVKTQSDESTEKKEETIEQKPATNSWITKELIAIAIGTAIGAYALYKFMDWVINTDYKIPSGKDDEYSDEYAGTCLWKGEGIDNSIRNEKIALDAMVNGGKVQYFPNTFSAKGKPTRLVSLTGKIVKKNHVKRYKAKWEAYKKEHYPGLHL